MHRKREISNIYILPSALILCTVWLFVRSETAEESAYEALKMCASVIVPSLFPFMVISSMLVRSGAALTLGNWITRPVRHLFRLPGCAGSAVLLGALCGFPVGAKISCEMYEHGFLTKRECQRLIAIANNTGPSFVIEVVGAHFWGSRGMGLSIYAAQILSAMIIGWITSRKESAHSESPMPSAVRCDALQCLASSVSQAARSVLSVCGFIVFFAVIASIVKQQLSDLRLDSLSPWIAAVLEFSTGASLAADNGGVGGAFLTGFAVGWSGVSVFAQCKAFTAPYGISLRFAAVCKAIQGVLTGAAAALYFALRYTPSATVSTVIPVQDASLAHLIAPFLLLAIASGQIRRKNS